MSEANSDVPLYSESNASSHALEKALDEQRRRLLDIGKRNPLTNTPLTKNRTNQLRIVDELSDQIFDLLYRNGRTFTFLPRASDDSESGTANVDPTTYADYVPPELEAEVHARHTDTKLQSILTPAELHKRLLKLSREARTLEEEQGVSVLYLALGFLKYYESESSGLERYAPLLLVPVDLKRDNSRGMFRLAARDDDLEANKCLTMMCLEDHDLALPEFDNATDDWLPSEYFKRVMDIVTAKERWAVEPNRMLLSFFSFGRFLMYRDLEGPSAQNQIVSDLLIGTASSATSEKGATISAPYEGEKLDKVFANPRELGHILDADTSQTRVIAEAAHGENIVVQGPPGTGKSQTITNMIAVAVRQGKRVLFVAEKRAALDVVKKRLERCGLGPLCLELHSHKANRKLIYDDLKRTFELGQPATAAGQDYDELVKVRDKLNELAELVHAVDPKTGNTAFRLMGRLSQLIAKGTPIVDFDLPDLSSWTIEEFDERYAYVQTYADATLKHGLESEHVWRGVQTYLDVVSQQQLTAALPATQSALTELTAEFEKIAQSLGLELAGSTSAAENLIQTLALLQDMPTAAKQLVQNDSVMAHLDSAEELCGQLKDYEERSQTLLAKVSNVALEQDWELHHAAVRQAGSSLFRFFNSRYRAAIAQLKAFSLQKPPSDFNSRVELLEQLAQTVERRKHIEENDRFGEALFGLGWKRAATDFEATSEALNWLRSASARLDDLSTVKTAVEHSEKHSQPLDADELTTRLTALREALKTLFELLQLDQAIAFGTDTPATIALDALAARLQSWEAELDSLPGYQDLRTAGAVLDEHGLSVCRKRIGRGELAAANAPDTFMLARSRIVLDQILDSRPEFAELKRVDRSNLVEQFKNLDENLQKLAAQEIAAMHYENIPRGSSGMVGYVRGELNKKRRHAPIRKLLDTAGEVIVSMKPIFLMSPLSVAQFLSPNGVKFDVLLIDEASQIKPSEALGCIMRTEQVIVVGDQKQLPPTSFFDRQVDGRDEDADDVEEELDEEELLAQQSADMESILTLFDARGVKSEMLQWHYRSNHSSLIEVSNVEFYDEKLAFPPSPNSGQSHGMQFVHVPNGVYSRGKQRNNDIEADTVCEHVVEHIRANPSLTLGVVTLSTAQRDLIQLKIDQLCRELPEVESFCGEDGDEPFFVKNLENVQGDERDAIYVSIGYGKDQNGYFAQAFGPVSSEGGERRLNVLFTRARNTCKIFASIRHEDIRLDAARHDGPRVLKRFLKFAETGDLDIPMSVTQEMDSPFEEDVADVIQKHGYTIHPQVGTGGFRIDLAVVNPAAPQNYLIAIECDGARYHSSSWARERDRLRQSVLESKGWHFHRIWSTDWFYNRNVEVSRLIDAIKQREAAYRSQRHEPVDHDKQSTTTNTSAANEPHAASSIPSTAAATDPIERATPEEAPSQELKPYQEYEGQLNAAESGLELLETPMATIQKYVRAIVREEMPVHSDIVIERIRSLWGLRKTGSRIRDMVQRAIDELVHADDLKQVTIRDHGPFLSAPGSVLPVKPRYRAEVQISKLRDPRYVSSEEINLAIIQIVNDSVSISVDDAAKAIAKLIGANLGREYMREKTESFGRDLARDGRIGYQDDTFTRV